MPTSFDQFTLRRHCYMGIERDVFSCGEGPIIVLMHESPNPYPEVFDFGLRLVREGYNVHIPVFFGVPNEAFSRKKAIAHLSRLCIQKEIAVFASHQSSPITEWLRSFCIDIQREKDQTGIGIIGMCLTGNFALTLLAEPWMLAPVLCQPSLPFALTPKLAKGLHVSQETIQKAKQRQDLQILGLRFTHDFLCPKIRFDQLRNTFGTAFQGIEINSGPFNGHSIPLTAHSVLTKDFVNEHGHPTHEALCTTIDFLNQHLQKTMTL